MDYFETRYSDKTTKLSILRYKVKAMLDWTLCSRYDLMNHANTNGVKASRHYHHLCFCLSSVP